jgi:ribosomal protein S8E
MKLTEAVWMGGKLQKSRSRSTKAEMNKKEVILRIQTEKPAINIMSRVGKNEKIRIKPNGVAMIGNMELGKVENDTTKGEYRVATKNETSVDYKEPNILKVRTQTRE